MKLAIFLHAYQPPTQYPGVTAEITKQSYFPIIETLESSATGKITLNMSGSLIEQLLANEEEKLLGRYKKQVLRGTIEYVGTAAYHPLLTKLPKKEIVRQDSINEYWLKKWLGEAYKKPSGFFIPEMVYDESVGEAVSALGYSWTILDESAFPGASTLENGKHGLYSIGSHQYKIKNTDLQVFFRDRPLSLAIAFSKNLTLDSLIERLLKHKAEFGEQYAIVALDAETFGYHHKERIKLLKGLFDQDQIDVVTVSEIINSGIEVKETTPIRSTWGVTIEEPNQKRTFPRWDNPESKVHKLQWELFNMALEKGIHVSDLPDDLDKALHSDQFWWASKSPCWHPGMIERSLDVYEKILGGATQVSTLRDVLKNEKSSTISC